MEQKTQRNGLINLLALVLVGGAAFGVAQYGNTLAGLIGAVFIGLGALVAAVSWFQMRLEEREHLEKMEFQELTKSAASSALFNPGESEVFPAQRSREQFEKFFVPLFTVLLIVLQIGGSILLWRRLKTVIPTPLEHPAVPLAMFAVFFLVLFLLGKYSSSVARLEKVRLLRAGAGHLLLDAYVCFFVTASVAVVWLGYPLVDLYVARAFTVLLMLVGIETAVNLIFELYRPRVKGKVERPVYESRLVSLLGQPEGLITTAAQTLDYQFGFKVSETWAYRLMERYLPWLIVGQVLLLFFSTSVVSIEPGQEAILEHFGNPIAVLEPGLHGKCPWPIDHVYRYSTARIQTFNVGFVPDETVASGNTVLWTVPHAKEDNFLVANRAVVTSTNTDTGERPPPVSLLTVGIPVQYQITNLMSWVYNNEDPNSLLSFIAQREVARYFVSVDLGEIMSRGRWEAAQTLRQRIQDSVNEHKMGANIVFVGLSDIHPPVKVAPDYEKVVAAIDTKEATILTARAGAIMVTNYAGAQAFKTVSEATSEGLRLRVDTLAQAALFTNQIPAYEAAPAVYAQRAYLQTLTRSITNARTYVILATNTQDVVILDLEDKLSPDLAASIAPPPPKTAPK